MDREFNLEESLLLLNMKKNKKRSQKFIQVIIVIAIIVFSVIAGMKLYFYYDNLPSENAEPIEYLDGIPVIEDILDQASDGRLGILRKIKYVVIHETGNQDYGANASSHALYIHKQARETKVSWHYTVDEKEIYHHIPDNEIAYHAGDGLTPNGGNTNGIAIEICRNEDGDYEKALENAAKLTARLLTDYKLSIDDVKKHQDFSGKNCPEILISTGRWEEFIEMIKIYL